MIKKMALAGILGLSLTTCINTGAFAQNMDMESPWEKMTDEELAIPVWAASYPMASPGSLHLWHWRGYARDTMAPGSVNDVRFEHGRRKDRMYAEVRKTYWDKLTADQKQKETDLWATPVMADYNRASPGSLHMWHWHGIAREKWMAGSVDEMRMQQEKMKDEMWYGEMKKLTWTDEELDMKRDPIAIDYPRAAPGSLHLYHWKDYTQNKMMGGSVTEYREERDKKNSMMRYNERKMLEKK
jgi:hypothetical protein